MSELKKTRTKAFRFDVGLIDNLRRGAALAGLSENAFLSSILAERLFADPLVKAFHRISFDDEAFRCVLGGTNSHSLEVTGFEIARKDFPVILELYRGRGYALTFRRFVIDVLGKYNGWFWVEGDGCSNLVTLRHTFGLKWSMFLKSYVEGAYSTIAKDRIKIEVEDQFIRVDLDGFASVHD